MICRRAEIERAGKGPHHRLQPVEQIVGGAGEQEVRRGAGARFSDAPLQQRAVEDAGRRGGRGHAGFRLTEGAITYHIRSKACDEFVAQGRRARLLHKRNTQRKPDVFVD